MMDYGAFRIFLTNRQYYDKPWVKNSHSIIVGSCQPSQLSGYSYPVVSSTSTGQIELIYPTWPCQVNQQTLQMTAPSQIDQTYINNLTNQINIH